MYNHSTSDESFLEKQIELDWSTDFPNFWEIQNILVDEEAAIKFLIENHVFKANR